MKAQTFKFGTAVRVQWVDSAMRRGWSRPDSDGPYAPQRIVSQGFVVESNDKGLTITSSIDDENSVIGPMIMPWGCIENLQVLPQEFHHAEIR